MTIQTHRRQSFSILLLFIFSCGRGCAFPVGSPETWKVATKSSSSLIPTRRTTTSLASTSPRKERSNKQLRLQAQVEDKIATSTAGDDDGPTSQVGSVVKGTEGSFLDEVQEKLQTSLSIIQESRANGYNIQQLLANVLAGEYDQESVRVAIDTEIAKAPCVMFSWERSPSCVKAVEAFKTMGILDQIHIKRLDDPWDEGNPLRAELGKRVGRSSVPMIFIGGEYVGGFDGGLDDQRAPGIQAMAFQGTLRPALEAAGIELP